MDRSRGITFFGWIVAVAAAAVYIFTLEPTVSFWDCGEFIATSRFLEVGHPPGAPLYSLLAHCFMLFASSPGRVAWWSNALSAVAGGFTAMFLFWTIYRLIGGAWKTDGSDPSADNRAHSSLLNLVFSLVGTACYVFCDTAWFSAVESEVYSLSMLFSSAIVWAMVRWAQCDDRSYAPRWLMLTSLLLALSVGVHQLSLLTIPALLVIFFTHRRKLPDLNHQTSNAIRRMPSSEGKSPVTNLIFVVLFFLIGLTPYLIIPIRAAADPPINMGKPDNAKAFHDYFTRSQYEHAPLLYGRCYNSPVVAFDDGKAVYASEMNMLFPRMWKHGTYSDLYYNDWCGRHGKMVNVGGNQYYKPSQLDNLIIFTGYQVGYMYLRYLMWNFSGRYNDRQGFGNLQKGQFISGIPLLDRLYIGTSARMPDSMPRAGHNRYFMLPLLLGIVGVFVSFKRMEKRWAWMLMTLFLMSSLALSVYLNHPMYEPRERDYAYILSFYTFAIWIALGTKAIVSLVRPRHREQTTPLSPYYRRGQQALGFLLLAVPLLMAFQNWDDHDRSGRYIARDMARNMLESCDENGILFTFGDNDTFPLWYIQQVEQCRTDVLVVNISLLATDSYAQSIDKQLAANLQEPSVADDRLSIADLSGSYRRMMAIVDHYYSADTLLRPAYFSHYAENDHRVSFYGHLQLCGMVYRLVEDFRDTNITDTVDQDRCYRLMTGTMRWEPLEGVYIDEISHDFLRQYWLDAILAAENLANAGREADARKLLITTRHFIPLGLMCDPQLTYQASKAFGLCGDSSAAATLANDCRRDVGEQLRYYATMKPGMQQYIPYTINPLRVLHEQLLSETSTLQH